MRNNVGRRVLRPGRHHETDAVRVLHAGDGCGDVTGGLSRFYFSIQNGLQAKSGFEVCFAIGSQRLRCWAKTRLHTSKAVTYHEQPHIMNHT